MHIECIPLWLLAHVVLLSGPLAVYGAFAPPGMGQIVLTGLVHGSGEKGGTHGMHSECIPLWLLAPVVLLSGPLALYKSFALPGMGHVVSTGLVHGSGEKGRIYEQ